MKIELYINKQLCDIQDNMNITLRRVFFNPAELNTKDAQKSYKISLPATRRNNEIFGFKNVEEVKGKFVKVYDAYLIINGVTVLDGAFRMSEIIYNSYTGNLGVPAAITVKDIFGDMNMNQAGEWQEPFTSFPDSINGYNQMDNPSFFFPYALYGLLPKKKDIDGNYSPKKLWDNTVVLAMDDFPPSINCMEAIKHIFDSKGYTVTGSAFSDKKLSGLYMSYKNPTDYDMQWPYRGLVNLELSGSFDIDVNDPYPLLKEFHLNTDNNCINFDVLSNNTDKATIIDNLGDIYDEETGIITVPVSGVYEVELSNITTMFTGSIPLPRALIDDINIVRAPDVNTAISLCSHEVKLLVNGDLDNMGIDRKYGNNNTYQNNTDWVNAGAFPKYFPQANKTMIVDASQNDNLICGLSFGKDDLPDVAKQYYTPTPCPLIQNNGWSWNRRYDQTEENFISSNIEGYDKATLLSDGTVSVTGSDYNKKIIDNISNNAVQDLNAGTMTGNIKCYVYFERGDKLSLVLSTSITDEYSSTSRDIFRQSIDYNLHIRPVAFNKDFVNTISDASQDYIDANSDILKDKIDLIKFLPSEQKIDDWIDNFCKAFNLQLSQSADKAFELNVKQKNRTYGNTPIDMDKKANVNTGRNNTSLELPSYYDIGFTINEDEQGYTETGQTGTEIFSTGSITGNTLSQTSGFSFNWLKDIEYGQTILKLPVITDKEVWEIDNTRDYEDMMLKTYTDYAQRFWYKGDNFTYTDDRGNMFIIALVKSGIDGVIDLSYYNTPLSILRNYFTVLVDSNTDYTTIECILTPEEYTRLSNSYIRFNGDIYTAAEIDKFDPLGRMKATLKLISK